MCIHRRGRESHRACSQSACVAIARDYRACGPIAKKRPDRRRLCEPRRDSSRDRLDRSRRTATRARDRPDARRTLDRSRRTATRARDRPDLRRTLDRLPRRSRYRYAIRVIGFANLTFYIFIYGDRYYFDSKAGYAWSPDHYDEKGNTTLEFEMMLISTYFVLGLCMIGASFDDNLDKCAWLVNFCIFGAFGAHGVAMIFGALNDWEREWGHVMPYGDVPLLMVFSTVLYILKGKYEGLKAN